MKCESYKSNATSTDKFYKNFLRTHGVELHARERGPVFQQGIKAHPTKSLQLIP
jgi:hypothetical protein